MDTRHKVLAVAAAALMGLSACGAADAYQDVRDTVGHAISGDGGQREQSRTGTGDQGSGQPDRKAPAPDSTESRTRTVVEQFYAYINAGRYSEAYALGSPALLGEYETFATGYSDTVHTTVSVHDVQGNVAHVTIVAEHTDGTVTQYAGTYTVEGGTIVAAEITEY